MRMLVVSVCIEPLGTDLYFDLFWLQSLRQFGLDIQRFDLRLILSRYGLIQLGFE